jgi:hypothetical protein
MQAPPFQTERLTIRSTRDGDFDAHAAMMASACDTRSGGEVLVFRHRRAA